MGYLVWVASLVFGLLSFSAPVSGVEKPFKPAKLKPLQEAHLDPSLQQFWKLMALAARERDFSILEPHLDTDLKWTLGPETGLKSFLRFWNLDKNPRQSVFWKELDRILNLGGAFVNGDRSRFQAPYVSACWPDDYDGFAFAAIIAENVPLRKTSEPTGKVLGWLSYDIVKLSLEKLPQAPRQKLQGETHIWVPISDAHGNVGFVWGKYIRSPIDKRLMVEKKNNVWKITYFLSGD